MLLWASDEVVTINYIVQSQKALIALSNHAVTTFRIVGAELR